MLVRLREWLSATVPAVGKFLDSGLRRKRNITLHRGNRANNIWSSRKKNVSSFPPFLTFLYTIQKIFTARTDFCLFSFALFSLFCFNLLNGFIYLKLIKQIFPGHAFLFSFGLLQKDKLQNLYAFLCCLKYLLKR